MPPREIGSFFPAFEPPEIDAEASDPFAYLGDVEWFSTGRMALAALGDLQRRRPARLHVPAYFCGDVVRYLRAFFVVRVYMDSPLLPSPRWETLRAAAGDMVLAVDYFGLRPMDFWRDWHASNPDTILVQDHTHSPLPSRDAVRGADYAFASVRKSLPVCDGAWLASPAARPLPTADAAPPETACREFRDAARLKRAYLQGEDVAKDAFLSMFRRAEHMIESQAPSRASASTARDLSRIGARELLERRHRNTATVISDLRDRPPTTFSVLPALTPEPWNPVLRFPDTSCREAVRQGLVARGIFAPVHWPVEAAGLPESCRDAARHAACLLTLPVDYRCTPDDLALIREALDELDGTPVSD